ncbi:RsmB/NOP family class I SAM-dependent RNA methyltransferase [Aquabacterium sp. A3]|uniref:RsmB/NOP family class I SAM-dependent RNA methyltransferase n=1 Tax=Aquabacterium sp. A3 TaxID=3132829 RepID=UPI0031195E01
MSLPAEFLSRFEQLCPPHRHAEALASFQHPKVVSFRLNRLHPDASSVIPALRAAGLTPEPVPWAQNQGVMAWQCPPAQRDALTHGAWANDGRLYIQSLSSMLAPILLAPTADEWVLDLAAAPGGKTILMAEMMGNAGKISAVEPVHGRFHRLKANLERMGISNTRCYLKDGREIGRLKPDSFQRVMLDAPCSSESRFRSDEPDSTEHWSLRKVTECARKQERLILSAFDALAPGGHLLYCTCSYAPEENERVVAHLLKKRDAAEVLPMPDWLHQLSNITAGLTSWQDKPLPEACTHTVRVWPTAEMDGFYLALVRKRGP